MKDKPEARLTDNTVEIEHLTVLGFVLSDQYAARVFHYWRKVKEQVREVIERHLLEE